MKKSKILLFGIIALISTAIFYELFLQYEKRAIANDMEEKRLEAIRNEEIADSIATAKANILTDADSLRDYSTYISEDIDIITILKDNGNIRMNGYEFHIDDVEIYHNPKQRLTYFVCKNHEKEAFYYEETDTDLVQVVNRNNVSDRGCLTHVEKEEKLFSQEFKINKTQLDDLRGYLEWFKNKYGLTKDKNIVVKSIPKSYLDNEGFFIAHANSDVRIPIVTSEPSNNYNNHRHDPSKREFVKGFDPSPNH